FTSEWIYVPAIEVSPSTIAALTASQLLSSPDWRYPKLPAIPVAIKVALAVPATAPGLRGSNTKRAMVTKMPPGPMVVIQMPPMRAMNSRNIRVPRLIEEPRKEAMRVKTIDSCSEVLYHAAKYLLNHPFSGADGYIDRKDY